MSKPRLLLIDGHSLAYRAFYGLPVENFATSDGQATNAVYGFTSMLISLLRDEEPSHVAVAFDVSRTSFRTDSYPEYKANRAASPAEFRGQVPLIKQVLDALHIAHGELPGYEADDIIATLASNAVAAGFEVLVCTGDRDALQLVCDDVTVLYPKRGVSEMARLTPAAVEEKYLVVPDRYPELAALVGETSDNLPGVPGVGPKTAAKWLTQFDGLDNLIARAEQVPGKAGESFREHLADVSRNRKLNRLVRDLQLPASLDDTARQPWDKDAVFKLFDELEFRTLRRRLTELGESQAAETADVQVTEVMLPSGELGEWLAAASQPVGLQLVGSWGSGTGDVHGVALADAADRATFLDIGSLAPADSQALADWLADDTRQKVLHDAKGAMLAFGARGWELRGVQCDTLLAAYLVRPGQRSYDLAELVLQYLGLDLSVPDAAATEQLPLDIAGDHGPEAMLQATAVRKLALELLQQLERLEQLNLLTELELPVQRVLAAAERVGIAVDADRLAELRTEFEAAVQQASSGAFAVLGHEVNLSSPKQLQAVLFDELQMPKTRRTKSGYTTDAEALEWLHSTTGHPFLTHLLSHRDAIKLRQTIDGLLAAVQPDGRIHSTFLQHAAATGRLSSADPNLQNIPVRTAQGRQIRSAFVPGDGYAALLSADYSQIEMRVMAHLSADAYLLDAFQSGRDFHAEMAALVFGVSSTEVTAEMRAKIKAMNYGLAYGLSAYGLSNQLKISVTEAQYLLDEYFARVGTVREYLDSLVTDARTRGYTATMLGRRRYLPDLNSSDRRRREIAERAALNSPIQGSAADIVKLAMLKVDQELRNQGCRSRVLLQVHDELLLEIAPGEETAVAELVKQGMEAALPLSLPLTVAMAVGDSWFAAAH